jgi:hypothetical protein
LASVVSHASASANSPKSLLVRAAAQRFGQLADFGREPQEGAVDAARLVLM